jgi:hypothetical protein
VYLLSVIFPVFKKWRFDPFIFKNLFYVHFTPIFHQNCVGATFKTHYLSNHNWFRYKNLLRWSWDHRLLIFQNRTDFFGFWQFKYPVSRSGGSDMPCTPSFFQFFSKFKRDKSIKNQWTITKFELELRIPLTYLHMQFQPYTYIQTKVRKRKLKISSKGITL